MSDTLQTFFEIFKNMWNILKSLIDIVFRIFFALAPIMNVFVMFLNAIGWICNNFLSIFESAMFIIVYFFEKFSENINKILKSILDLINIPLGMINTLIEYILLFIGYIAGYLYLIFSFANYSANEDVLF